MNTAQVAFSGFSLDIPRPDGVQHFLKLLAFNVTRSRAGRYSTKLVAYGAEPLDGTVQFVSLFVKPLAINVRLTVRVQHGDEIVQ